MSPSEKLPGPAAAKAANKIAERRQRQAEALRRNLAKRKRQDAVCAKNKPPPK